MEKTRLIGLMALVVCTFVFISFGQPDGEDIFTLDSLFDSTPDIPGEEIKEMETGDLREFRVVTDDDISGLEVGDIYRNNTAVYKVITVDARDREGGRFTVQRTGGTDEPTRTWTRVSGLGPLTITGRETLLSRFVSGGPLMYPIALLLLVMIVIAVNNGFIYRYKRHCSPAFVKDAREAVNSGNIKMLAERAAAAGRGLLPAICLSMTRDFEISTEEDIRIRCEAEARRQVSVLRIPLRALNFIAATAPLLGLLGTVTGMIVCFDSLAEEAASAGKSQAMAAGIKVALLTTAFGLSVAVPTMLAYFIGNQKLSGIVAQCELYTTELVHRLGIIKRNRE